MPRPILHLFAHPAAHRSRVNRPLVDAVKDLDGVHHVDLYGRYPDFDIDVAAEQEALVAAELVVFHHPFFWYSSPALLKEWQDLVLEHGFAYGTGGDALHGKSLLTVVTTGGVEEAYCPQGHNHYTMQEFLRPFEQTADLCGMAYLPPFVVHGTHRFTGHEVEGHAQDLRHAFERLLDERTDLSALRGERLQEALR